MQYFTIIILYYVRVWTNNVRQRAYLPNTDQESEINVKIDKELRATISIAAEWQNLGALLQISSGTLDRIKHDEGGSGAISCLRVMLIEWRKRADPPPTWSELADAVELFNERKAEEIRTEFCQ